jgi:hypothetical protein
MAEIFGWSCIVTYRPWGAESVTEKEIHRRGNSPGNVTGAARRMNGYVSYRDSTPYTRNEWVRMFGSCAETGRQFYAKGT